MGADEVAATAKLLAESFADSVLIPSRYSHFLEFLVAQYVAQKRAQLPHAATLLGFYREEGGGAAEASLAGTAEISFNAMGSNVSSPSPPPPRDAPYICNMTVEQSLRRYPSPLQNYLLQLPGPFCRFSLFLCNSPDPYSMVAGILLFHLQLTVHGIEGPMLCGDFML